MRLIFFVLDLGTTSLVLLWSCLDYYFLCVDFIGVFLLADCYFVGVFDDMANW